MFEPTPSCSLCDLFLCLSQKNQVSYLSDKGINPFLIRRILIISAAYQQRWPIHGLNALNCCIWVRSLGVIIINNTIYFGHIFNTVLYRLDPYQYVTDIFQTDAVGQSHSYCCADILIIMSSRQIQFLHTADGHDTGTIVVFDHLSIQVNALF